MRGKVWDAMHGKVRLATLSGAVVGLGLLLAVLAVVGPVPLLTVSDGDMWSDDEDIDICMLSHATGMLIPDLFAGTAIVQGYVGDTVPVRWPKGYTARRSLGQVEVLDRAGHVVARTGQWYYLPGGYDDSAFRTCTNGVSTSWPTSRPPTPTAVPSRRCGIASCRRGRRFRRPRGRWSSRGGSARVSRETARRPCPGDRPAASRRLSRARAMPGA